jgi:WD40 repeat protein
MPSCNIASVRQGLIAWYKIALARVPGADVVNPPTPARPWTSDSAPALRILRGQCLGVPAVFSEDGSQLLTRVQYNPMRLWDVHTGREFYRLPGMSSLVDSCFSADGSRVVSLSGSGMLHFYPTRFRDLMALADLRLRAARAALR